MKRMLSLPVWIALALGVLGAVLQQSHRLTCYDEKGYVIAGRPLTGFLIGAAAAIVILSVAAGTWYALRTRLPEGQAPVPPRPAGAAVRTCRVLAALLLVAFSVWQFVTAEDRGALQLAVCLAGLASALCLLALGLSAGRNAGSAGHAFQAALPRLFYCLLLVLHYIGNVSNPALLSYCMGCLAFAADSLFLFSMGAAWVEERQSFSVACFGLAAAGLSLLAMTAPQITAPDRTALAAAVLVAASHLLAIGIRPAAEEPEAPPPDGPADP